MWPGAPVDLRKFREPARRRDIDEASNISYNTTGSFHSHSSRICGDRRVRAAVGIEYGEIRPLANRTVVLQGLPKKMTIQEVKEEVKDAIVRLYRNDGFTFDPETHFHYGLASGIEVKKPAPGSRGDQNGGVCWVKFRYYPDANWLVSQAKGLRLVGTNVRALWASPKLQNNS